MSSPTEQQDRQKALEAVTTALSRGTSVSEPQHLIDAIAAYGEEVRRETWNEAIAVVKNPRLKSGLWTKREDEVAEVIQQRMAFALEQASEGKDYRNSLEAAAKK